MLKNCFSKHGVLAILLGYRLLFCYFTFSLSAIQSLFYLTFAGRLFHYLLCTAVHGIPAVTKISRKRCHKMPVSLLVNLGVEIG